MPLKAFIKAIETAGLTKKQQETMLTKLKSKDREFFTSNKKLLKLIGL